MKVSIVSVGCRTNQAENLQIETELRRAGHDIVGLSSSPDVCIVNTCAVTSRAESDSRRLISRCLEKSAKVIATGCFVQLNLDSLGSSPSERLRAVANTQKDLIPGMLGFASSGNTLSVSISGRRHRPVVKIQDGCTSSCSYCTIPLARGASRSVTVDKVIRRVGEYHSQGSQEIVLSGIDLGSYGRDLDPPTTLTSLLQEILLQTSVPRLRLSSLEAREVGDDLIEIMSEKRLCRHLHIPLQSGDDSILNAMNRPYTSEWFSSLAERLLSRLPGLALGTDAMVGFPGEEHDHYLRTLRMVESIPFAYLHVFPYSARPKTRAAGLPSRVLETDKRLRVEKLREISTKKRIAHIRANLGQRHHALIESRNGNGYRATTGNYIKALVAPTSQLSPGSLVDVVITGWDGELARATPAT